MPLNASNLFFFPHFCMRVSLFLTLLVKARHFLSIVSVCWHPNCLLSEFDLDSILADCFQYRVIWIPASLQKEWMVINADSVLSPGSNSVNIYYLTVLQRYERAAFLWWRRVIYLVQMVWALFKSSYLMNGTHSGVFLQCLW